MVRPEKVAHEHLEYMMIDTWLQKKPTCQYCASTLIWAQTCVTALCRQKTNCYMPQTKDKLLHAFQRLGFCHSWLALKSLTVIPIADSSVARGSLVARSVRELQTHMWVGGRVVMLTWLGCHEEVHISVIAITH